MLTSWQIRPRHPNPLNRKGRGSPLGLNVVNSGSSDQRAIRCMGWGGGEGRCTGRLLALCSSWPQPSAYPEPRSPLAGTRAPSGPHTCSHAHTCLLILLHGHPAPRQPASPVAPAKSQRQSGHGPQPHFSRGQPRETTVSPYGAACRDAAQGPLSGSLTPHPQVPMAS